MGETQDMVQSVEGEMMQTRYCAKCNAEITGCNGFTKAGDQLENAPQPRELCGRCALTVEWTAEGTLVPQDINAINAELRALR